MKKKLVGLILGTVMTITTLGGTSVMAADDGLTFAIVYPNIFPFFDAIGNGAEDKIEEMGQNITLIKEGAQNGDVSNQIQIMEDLINQKVDGIAIGPCDSEALTPYIDKAVDAGIQVLCFDTDAPDSKRVDMWEQIIMKQEEQWVRNLARHWMEKEVLSVKPELYHRLD